MTAYRFLEPLDVLFLRGNKLFGDPGSYGESMVPPWPSVAAGAIRSRMLVDDKVDLEQFRNNQTVHPVLGTPADPGSFTVTGFHLARRRDGRVESLHPLPADLLVTKDDDQLDIRRLQPQTLAAGIDSAASLPKLPVLAIDQRAKPDGGIWLTQAGWQACLDGDLPGKEQLVDTGSLWKLDPRVGIGLDPARSSAEDGKLFTVQAVAPNEGVGFLVGITGAEPPAGGLLRLGGDGRAAAISQGEYIPPQADLEAIAQAGRCRIILTSPGIFPDGWRPPGTDAEYRFSLRGVAGRLVCAAAPRAETISGWDLAQWRPKPAQNAAPAGSVFWLEALEATPEALHKLAETGLWPDTGYDAQRRAEGFNRFTFANY